MEDTLIIETPDAVLVTPINQSQEIKNLVSDLAKAGREESHQAKVVQRPWGTYETIAMEKTIKSNVSLYSQANHFPSKNTNSAPSTGLLLSVEGK